MYYEGTSGGRHVDLWASVDTLFVLQEDEHGFSIAGKQCVASAVPDALVCLRHVHSLSVRFGQYSALVGVVAVLEPLQHYRRLTSLDIDMRPLLRMTRADTAEVQDALHTTLSVIACQDRLTSLALHCAAGISPTVDVLRQLCSSVRQLTLSQTSCC